MSLERALCVAIAVSFAACRAPQRSPTGDQLAGTDWVTTQRDGATPRPSPPVAEAAGDPLTAKFAGTSRKTAKITLALAPVEAEYSSLNALFDTLYDDADMAEWAADDGIEKHADSHPNRMPEEERNVRVKAWLYAVKSESDKDFHIIIGTSPSNSQREYLNVEVSGLPGNNANDYQTLKDVREQLHDILGKWPSDSRYYKPPTPIAVEVQGSLFWDIEHAPGVVGPLGMRPDTSWEIHPISDLHQGHD